MRDIARLQMLGKIQNCGFEPNRGDRGERLQTEFLASRGPAGELDIFYMGPREAGSTGVFNLQREQDSPTGWRYTDLANDFTPAQIASGLDPEAGNMQIAFAAELNDYGISIYWIQELKPGEWGKWQFLDPQLLEMPDKRVKAIRSEQIDGKLHLFAVLGVKPGKPFAPDEVWAIPWKNGLRECECLGEVSSDFMKYINVKGPGEGLLVTTLPEHGSTGEDLVFVKPGGVREKIAANARTALLGVEEQISGHSVVFMRADPVMHKGERVEYIDCSTKERVVSSIEGTENIVPKQLLPVDEEGLPLTLYILDDQNRLFITKRTVTQEGASIEWMPPLPLGFNYHYVAGGLNEDGYAQIFGLSAKAGAEDRLECIFKSPPVEEEELAPGWQWTTVDLPVTTMEKIYVYGTEIAVCDKEENILPETKLWLSASELVDVEINYQYHYVGTGRWVPVTTDAAGRITMIARTQSLTAPKWMITATEPRNINAAAVNAKDADLIVASDEHTFSLMKKMSLPETRDVLPEAHKKDAEHIHETIQKLMQIHAAAVPDKGRSLFTRLDTSRLPEESWHLTIDESGARFRKISKAEFRSIVTDAKAIPDGIFNDTIEFFTDAAHSVATGICDVFDCVVDVAEQITVHITLFIKEVGTYVFDGIVQFAEQVIQIAESVFNASKAFFEDLFIKAFGLILGNFLEGTRKAAEFMENHFEKVLNNLIDTVGKAKPHVRVFFDQQRTELKEGFDKVLEALEGRNADYRILHASTNSGDWHGGEIVDDCQGISVFSGFFMRKALSPKGNEQKPPFDPGKEILDEITEFITKLNESITDAFRDQIDAFLEFLGTEFQSAEAVLAASLKLIVQTVRNLLDTTLDFGEEMAVGFLKVIELILKGFKAFVLDMPLDNFFLKAIYKLADPQADPEEPTIGRLLFLLAGAPVAIGWRVLFHNTFPLMKSHVALPLYSPDAENGAETSPEEDYAILRISGGIMRIFPTSIVRVAMDCFQTPMTTEPFRFLAISAAFWPLVVEIHDIPQTFFTDWDPDLPFWDNLGWLCNVIVPSLMMVLACVSPSVMVSLPSTILNAISGALAFSGNLTRLGVHLAHQEYDDIMLYAGIVAPWSSVIKPLKYLKIHGIPVGLVPVLAGDAVCDLGCGVCDIIGGIKLIESRT